MKWISIRGFTDYQISEKGNIRRIRDVKSGTKYTNIKPTLIGRNKEYTAVNLWDNGERKIFLVHKLYADAFGVSVKDAIRIVYKGYEGNAEAKYNVSHWVMEMIIKCENQQENGVNMHDEILYLKEFLKIL